MTTYSRTILRTAPWRIAAELEESARVDGHWNHSMLSLAVELDVAGHRVYDAVQAMLVELVEQDDDLEQDDAERIAYAWQLGFRYRGSIDLPAGHPFGEVYAGDVYLSADAISYVRSRIRPPSFADASPAVQPPVSPMLPLSA